MKKVAIGVIIALLAIVLLLPGCGGKKENPEVKPFLEWESRYSGISGVSGIMLGAAANAWEKCTKREIDVEEAVREVLDATDIIKINIDSANAQLVINETDPSENFLKLEEAAAQLIKSMESRITALTRLAVFIATNDSLMLSEIDKALEEANTHKQESIALVEQVRKNLGLN